MKKVDKNPPKKQVTIAVKSDKLKGKLLEALQKSLGNISQACTIAGCNRDTYYRYLDTDPAFKAKVNEISEVAKDFVEGKLMKAINNDDLTAIIFYLKCKAKDRGYIDKQEMDVSGKVIVVKTGDDD